MGILRQEYWSGLPCLPPGDLPDPGLEPRSPTLQADSLPSEPQIRFGTLGQTTLMKQCWNSTLTTQAGSPSQYLRETRPSVYRGGLVGANRAEKGGDSPSCHMVAWKALQVLLFPKKQPTKGPSCHCSCPARKTIILPSPYPQCPAPLEEPILEEKAFEFLLHYVSTIPCSLGYRNVSGQVISFEIPAAVICGRTSAGRLRWMR